jgi:cbb3-type cytochrome oxidase cytochrome c subunit
MKLRAGEWVVVGGALFIGAFAALVGTLIYLKPPPAEYAYADSAAAQQGEAIYRRESCRDCHKVFGNGSSSGPRLDGVGSRRSTHWLQAYLIDPRPGVADKPYRTRMPAYGHLKAEERDALVAYLSALNAPQAPSPAAQRSRPQ